MSEGCVFQGRRSIKNPVHGPCCLRLVEAVLQFPQENLLQLAFHSIEEKD